MNKRRERGKLDLEAMVSAGEASAYEALELYKSKANRFKLKNDVEQAIDVLKKGAVIMILNGYYTCADELCCSQLIPLLTESNSALTLDTRGAINSIDNAFADQGHDVRYKFLAACVRWSAATTGRKHGDPLLQTQLATCLWARGEKSRSLHHFAAGEAPDKLWSMMEKVEGSDGPSAAADREAMAALGVLHFLSLENLRDANELWRKYSSESAASGQSSGLSTFIGYLLQTCERDAGPLFQKICEKYHADLQFDPVAMNLLQGPIGSKLFNIQPPARAGGFMSMFQDLLGGGDGGGLF